MKCFRGRIFTLTGNPFSDPGAWTLLDDGCLAVDAGRIVSVGPWAERSAEGEVVDFGAGKLIVPGFVDLHLHAPQLEMIGSYGGHLLEWLERYTFPNEAKFASPAHAERVSRSFFDELYRHGTLTALIFSTIHAEATDILFSEAERRKFRAVLGKTMMDRNAPDALLEDPRSSFEQSRELAHKWIGRGKLGYAITPRFAPTSTPELLELAGELAAEFPRAWVHTHISENISEIAWVRELFPGIHSYAGVYDRFGLLGPRTVLAHGIHLSDAELDLLVERGVRIAHCPNSNLFLGSGLFPMQSVRARGIPFGLGTDIGAGTTLSMFTVMADAYKVQQVLGNVLTPIQLWYLATLAGAEALSLEGETGSLEPGKAADFVVIDLAATPLLEKRAAGVTTAEELLAALIFLGDDRAIGECWVEGEKVSQKSEGRRQKESQKSEVRRQK